MFKKLLNMIENREAKIGVYGQGYVGLPLAISFALNGFLTYGVDINKILVDSLNRGKPLFRDAFVERNIRKMVKSKKYKATTDGAFVAREVDICIVCVPTPLDEKEAPDLTYMRDAIKTILNEVDSGKLVVVESSTYPGSIEEIVVPTAEQMGLKLGKDLFLAHCPERVDPRNTVWTLHNTPRVVGGHDVNSSILTKALYQTIMEAPLINVVDIKTAEAVKELENTFRLVNISLVNEFALYCERVGVDSREVVDAASTKPFGFTPHYPGPGAGGHCIPVDPVYLLYSGGKLGVEMKLIEAAVDVNNRMIDQVVNHVKSGFIAADKRRDEGYTVVVGLSYKEDIDDLRVSQGKKIASKLIHAGFKVKVFEPNIGEDIIKSLGFDYILSLDKNSLKDVICLCVVQMHSSLKPVLNKILCEGSVPIIIDCKNELSRKKGKKGTILIKLGSGN